MNNSGCTKPVVDVRLELIRHGYANQQTIRDQRHYDGAVFDIELWEHPTGRPPIVLMVHLDSDALCLYGGIGVKENWRTQLPAFLGSCVRMQLTPATDQVRDEIQRALEEQPVGPVFAMRPDSIEFGPAATPCDLIRTAAAVCDAIGDPTVNASIDPALRTMIGELQDALHECAPAPHDDDAATVEDAMHVEHDPADCAAKTPHNQRNHKP